jgi:hypothetical protein
MKNDLFFQVMMDQKLLDHLNHFLVSAGKTGTSQANPDFGFVFFHATSKSLFQN